ncbi:MAG: hypothetical protein Q4E74_08035 [Ruminococcus sp.]|nr:hypothetical protein [Ruminococcus sp.]
MAFLFNGRSPRNIDFNGNPVSKVVFGSAVIWEKVHRVKYIKSHGTEHIDTGFKPDSNTRVQITCEFYDLNTAYGIKGMFGGRLANGNSGISVWHETSTGIIGKARLLFQYGNENSSFISGAFCGPDTKYIIDVNKNTLTCTTENGEEVLSRTDPECEFQSSVSIMIFTVHNINNIDSRKGVFKLYGCKIWDNGVLVRDFIPCLDGAGTPCLYDEVEQKFYYNSGTGNFETEE